MRGRVGGWRKGGGREGRVSGQEGRVRRDHEEAHHNEQYLYQVQQQRIKMQAPSLLMMILCVAHVTDD